MSSWLHGIAHAEPPQAAGQEMKHLRRAEILALSSGLLINAGSSKN